MTNEDAAGASDPLPAPAPAYADIQGLMVNGYRGYNFIRFLLYTVPPANVAGARALCGALIPGTAGSAVTLTAATRWTGGAKPAYRLNLGVSRTGLKKLIGPDNYATVMSKSSQLFSPFERGASSNRTAVKVGDTGPSDPQQWWQSGGWQLKDQNPTKTDLDLLFVLYAPTPEERDEWHGQLTKMIGPNSAVLAYMQDSDPLDPVGQQIHFGYRDGISQPRIAGFSEADPDLDDRLPLEAWRFMIEETTTKRPTTSYTAHPLLKNGSFGAFRVLYQDVKAFEDFIHQNGPENAERIAAKMCGRWRDGTPLEISPDAPESHHLLSRSLRNEYQLNNFDYVTPTPHQEPKPAPLGNPDTGQACPYAAHVRRSNPRDDGSVTGNTDPVTGEVLMAKANRVLRRARPYGPPYDPSHEGSEDQQRGLIGLFIGADLDAQFEFLMQTWITGGNFSTNDNSPNNSGYDPLFGPPPAAQTPSTSTFAYCTGDPANPDDYVTLPAPLPQLVITRGGLYVFIPGISALSYLAKGTIPPLPPGL